MNLVIWLIIPNLCIFFIPRLLDELGPTLRVANAIIRDAGSYQCIAYNSAGYVQSAATVRVNSK